jgi:hypothetical protein
VFKLSVRVSAQYGLGQSLGLVTQSIYIVVYLAIAQYYTHATTLVGLGLTEDADTCAILLQSLIEVIVQQRTVYRCRSLFWREDYS